MRSKKTVLRYVLQLSIYPLDLPHSVLVFLTVSFYSTRPGRPNLNFDDIDLEFIQS